MDFILDLLKDTISITAFVLIMMLIIEYVNVMSKGAFSAKLKQNKKSQIVVASLMAIIPGCLGTYTVVSLYTHNILSIGALTAAMLAASGDEAFFLLSFSPQNALFIFAILFALAIIVGLLVDKLYKKSLLKPDTHSISDLDTSKYFTFDRKAIINQLRFITFERASLIFGIVVFIILLLSGTVAHNHFMQGFQPDIHIEHHHEAHNIFEWNWFTGTLLFSTIILLIIVLHVPDRFLEHHLWEHIIKKHFLKTTLWTLVALLLIKVIVSNLSIESYINEHLWIILILALLVGIIPESGPHMIFITMYISGAIPMSILLANSIVQDGHGALPLFAESPKSFIFVKFINIIVGAIIGFSGLLFGF